MAKCVIHPECRATTSVNGVSLCYECWNNATSEERDWFRKATHMFSRGLITKEELNGILLTIGYHHLDPTISVYLDD